MLEASEKPLIIAEVKPFAPGGKPTSEKTWRELLILAAAIGDIVSIHTHPIWNGSFAHITEARELFPDIKILAKGFHGSDEEVEQALNAGADYVLTVGFTPTVYLNRCLLEPLTLSELQAIDPQYWAVWNSRNLASLLTIPGVTGIPEYLLKRFKEMESDSVQKKEPFKTARAVFLGNLCQASNLKTVDDIEPDADAVLVGTNLESFAASYK